MTDEPADATRPEPTQPAHSLIFSKLLELRRAIGGLKARQSTEAYGPKFPVRSSKELMEKLSQAVVDLDLLVYVVDQRVVPLAVDPVPDPKSNGTKAGGTCCYVAATVRVEAEDGSYRDFRGCGSGMDRDDKAGGKASTYSWKDALLKGLSIPDKDMIDTDDEAGQGRDVKPARKASGAGAPSKGGAVAAEASALAAINGAATMEDLKALIPLLERLPEPAQLRLDPAYQARKGVLA